MSSQSSISKHATKGRCAETAYTVIIKSKRNKWGVQNHTNSYKLLLADSNKQ